MIFDSDCDCGPDADTDTDRHYVVLKNPFLFGKDFQDSSTGTRQAVHSHGVTCGQQAVQSGTNPRTPGIGVAIAIGIDDHSAADINAAT